MILGSKLQIPLGSDHIVKNVLVASRCLAKYGAKLKSEDQHSKMVVSNELQFRNGSVVLV